MGLDININSNENEILVALKGDLDIYTSPDFSKNILTKFEEDNKNVVIDAEALDYIDSTGLGAFISVYKSVSEAGKDLKITKVKSNVKKIFVITELDKLFRIEE